ncbi:MAG: hypothetical protein HYX80_01245 [Chloroflexi bacterium]|nr:hypothetical protein [Chloroflexota bacterium]
MNKQTEFDGVLDECLERLLVKNETIEQCLQSFPQYSAELKPLLETALAARQASAVQPRPEFRDRARYEFNSALQEMGRKKGRIAFNWGWQPRWVTALVIILIVSLVGSGTVAAAAGSMPDSPLYSVKRATERVELTLTFSELSKAELQTRLAGKRVSEIAYLAEAGKPEKIAELAESLNNHLSEIAFLVSPPVTVSSLAVPAPTQAERATVPEPAAAPAPLPTPAPVAPGKPAEVKEKQETKETAVPQKERAGGNVTSQEERKKETAEDRSREDRRARLKTTVESQAKDNIARLRALLETAPESAKPALKRALESSEAEYKKAVEALDEDD